MHIIEILPALAGLYYFAMYSRLKRLLPLWFLVLAVSPVAAAMTLEDIPSTTRAFFMVLPLAFLAAVGTEWIFSKCRRGSSTLILVFLLGYIWSLAFFTHQFFTVMPVWQPWHRSRDYEIAARIISDNQHLFDEVIISNDLREMYIYLWMNGKISLPQLKEQPLARYQEKYTLGKYSFNRGHCDFSAADGEVLMVGSLECAKKAPKGNYFVLEPSRFDDGVPAFAMMTNAEATLSGKLNHLMPPSTIPHEPE